MLPIHQDPHFTFRLAEARIIPRFHLEGVGAGRRVSVFKIDPGAGERLGLLAMATVGEGGWVDLTEPIIERALNSIREFMDEDAKGAAYERFIAPASATVRFAKALNRSVTGSMNDMIKHAAYLTAGDGSPFEIGSRLNAIPMSALKQDGAPYGFPRDVFEALAGSAGGERPMPDDRTAS